MNKAIFRRQNGMALTAVMITLILLSLIAGYTMTLSYNNQKAYRTVTGTRIKAYYAAQAGAVDAQWRIRTGYMTCTAPACTNWTVGAFPGVVSFSNPLFFVGYKLDIDGDGVSDVSVIINPVDGNGLRPIISEGIDHY